MEGQNSCIDYPCSIFEVRTYLKHFWLYCRKYSDTVQYFSTTNHKRASQPVWVKYLCLCFSLHSDTVRLINNDLATTKMEVSNPVKNTR